MQFHKLLLAAALTVAGASFASAAVTYPQCPAVGAATGCNALVTVNADGSISVAIDATQPPFDNSEDSTIGVLNKSGKTLSSISLTGNDIFGFEGDGMCSGYTPNPTGNCSKGITTTDPYDYSGDFVTFTITDSTTGVVTFVGGLANGSSTYFSLEGTPDSLGLSGGNPVPAPTPTPNPTPAPAPAPALAPEPASLFMMSGGFAGLFLLGRRKLAR